MAKVKILVVEDESIVSKDIQDSIKKLGYDVYGSATSGEKAIEMIDSKKPDLILMDIRLKGELSGIETAKIIKEENNIPIIFLTAYADENTLAKAKVIQPHGYITKPFKEVDLHTTIEMALYKHTKDKDTEKELSLLYSLVENNNITDFIFVKSKSKLVKLFMNEIYFVEALKDYVTIHTIDAKYTIHSTMKDIERKLGEKEFIRIHRSFIVRLDKIHSIEQPNLFLEGFNKEFPIGGSYKDKLNQRINLV